MRLFVECKYVPSTTVFWFGDRDNAAATEWLIRNTPLREDNIYKNEHHYLKYIPRVAKLFASKNQPSTENEAIFRALNQTLNGLVALRRRSSILPTPRRGEIPTLATITLPLIVCNDFSQFFRVDMEAPKEPERISAGFLLETNYAYTDQNGSVRDEYFLLDIVAMDQLFKFFEVIEEDKDAVFRIL